MGCADASTAIYKATKWKNVMRQLLITSGSLDEKPVTAWKIESCKRDYVISRWLVNLRTHDGAA